MNNTIIFGNVVELVGIKKVFKAICDRSRRIGPRLYLKFLFRGKMVDNLSPGRDVMELRSLWHSATCLACIVVRT